MLSSSLSVRETRVCGTASRVPTIRRGLGFAEDHGALELRSPAKGLSYCLTTKSTAKSAPTRQQFPLSRAGL